MVEINDVVRRDGLTSGKKAFDALPVDNPVGRMFDSRQCQESWKNVQVDGQFRRHLTRTDMSRPFHNEGHPEPAFVALSLAASVHTWTSFIPGAVIAGKEDDRVLFNIQLPQFFGDFADAPVDFFDGVAEFSGF